MMNKIALPLALLLAITARPAAAQLRLAAAAEYGINIKRAEQRNNGPSEQFTSLGNYGINLSVARDKSKRLNYGGGLLLTAYHFGMQVTDKSLLDYNSVTNHTYRCTYGGFYPMLAFAFDRKGMFHCQLGAPVLFRLLAKEEVRRLDYGAWSRDTSYQLTENFAPAISQLFVRIAAYLPLARQKFSLNVSATYTGSLTSDALAVRPAQVGFGLGISYRYTKPAADTRLQNSLIKKPLPEESGQ